MNDLEYKAITLYPSDWYYNACLQGFLEILAYGMGEEVIEKEILKKDGTIVLTSEQLKIMDYIPNNEEGAKKYRGYPGLKNYAAWWCQLGNQYREQKGKKNDDILSAANSMFLSNNVVHPNFTQKKDINKELFNSLFTFKIVNILDKDESINCSFCNNVFLFKEEFDLKNKEDCRNNFFVMEISGALGSSEKEFPNAFWDNIPNNVFCPLCRTVLLSVFPVYENKLFINSGSITVNWYLNKIIKVAKKEKNNFIITDLFKYLLVKDKQIRRGLSLWQKKGFEIVEFRNNKNLNVTWVHPQIIKIMDDPTISGIIGFLYDSEIVNAILEYKINFILDYIYKYLKKDVQKNSFITAKLTCLYWQIQKLTKEVRYMVDPEKLINCAKYNSPENLKKKGNVLKLLELARLGKRDEVYYRLLRGYLAEGSSLPAELQKTFKIKDDLEFKNLIYAYISGLEIKNEGGSNDEN